MKLPVIDLIIFLVYMGGIVLYGASFYFRKRSSSEFVSGSGRIPSWAIGMSIFATFVSSISFLALPGSAYLNNWNGYALSLSIPIALLIAVTFFVPLYRRINRISAYHFLEMRFGLWARVYASACYLLTQLARMGAVLYLLALPLNAFLGWSIPVVIVITGICVIVYATLGGLEAVIWTDAVQGIILIAGALMCLIIIMFSMPEGPGQVFSIADAADKFSLGSFGSSLTESTFWVVFFYGLFINLQNFGIDQNYVQRYISAKTDEGAKRATWLGGLLYLPVSFLFFFIGTSLYAYYQAQPELLPQHLRGSGNADKVFPYFIVSSLPTGLIGLVIASIFAAGMSTISTSINSSATVILEDHFKKYISKDLSEKGSMKILTLSSIFMGILSIVVALSLNGVKSALDAYWALASIFSGGILGLFLLAVLGKNVKNIYAVTGVILGVFVIGWMSLSPVFVTDGVWRSPFHANLTIVFGTLVIFLSGFLFSLLSGSKKAVRNPGIQ
ncbi:MAG: sodium:solute symporter [Cyclobacteriaceae bacterium]